VSFTPEYRAADGTVPLVRPDTTQVVGADWAARYGDATSALAAALTTREPCPICGHPTGDCTGDANHG
jgi:hypothetical protein